VVVRIINEHTPPKVALRDDPAVQKLIKKLDLKEIEPQQ
jgi:hypothetical protein